MRWAFVSSVCDIFHSWNYVSASDDRADCEVLSTSPYGGDLVAGWVEWRMAITTAICFEVLEKLE